MKVWRRLDLDGKLGEVLAGIVNWKRTREAQFMPYAQGWLNGEAWKETPLAPQQQKGVIDERRVEQIRAARR